MQFLRNIELSVLLTMLAAQKALYREEKSEKESGECRRIMDQIQTEITFRQQCNPNSRATPSEQQSHPSGR